MWSVRRFLRSEDATSDRESGFLKLMQQREVENNVDPTILEGACLLCSEDSPDHCHRRLVAEYLRVAWGELEIVHLR